MLEADLGCELVEPIALLRAVEDAGAAELDPEEDVVEHRHRRGEGELLVNERDAVPDRVAGRPEAHRLAVDQDLPRSSGPAPATILPSVDLPAPFSPTRAWISPAAIARLTSSSARAPPYRLLTPRTSTRRPRHRRRPREGRRRCCLDRLPRVVPRGSGLAVTGSHHSGVNFERLAFVIGAFPVGEYAAHTSTSGFAIA